MDGTPVDSRTCTANPRIPGLLNQYDVLKMLMALNEGNGEAVAEIAIQMSERLEDFAASEFRRRITQLVALRRDQGMEQLTVGCFLAAAAGRFWLVIRIFVSDYRSRKKLTRKNDG